MDKIPLPNKFELHPISATKAQLVIEPLFSGFGTTIGNALRRILLSSIPGAAITAVKIHGAEHEFSTLEGVQEDVVDIILNFKKVRLAVHSDEEVRLKIKVKGKKEVTAADIEANAQVEVLNKDQHLATLTSDSANFEVEMTAQTGRGYWPTESRAEQKREIGLIAIDALFSPIRNVALKVDNVRVGQLTTFEQVTLDIETDGTIDIKQAVALASQVIVDHFSLLLEKDLVPQTVRTDIAPEVLPEATMPEMAESAPVAAPEMEQAMPDTTEAEVVVAPKKRGRPKKEAAAPEAV